MLCAGSVRHWFATIGSGGITCGVASVCFLHPFGVGMYMGGIFGGGRLSSMGTTWIVFCVIDL
eukprot:14514820-Ditylum_brightwellii.AAC.1